MTNARRAGRACGHMLGLCLVGLTLVGLAFGAILFRLSHGPISIDAFNGRIASELGARLGHGYRVELGPATLERSGNDLKLSLAGLSVKDSGGKSVFVAPRAEASVALAPLLVGAIKPTKLYLFDVELGLTRLENGALAVSAGADPVLLTPPAAAPDSAAPGPIAGQSGSARVAPVMAFAPLAATVSDILQALSDPSSPMSNMEVVALKGGRLAFGGASAGDDVTFRNVDLAFERVGGVDSLRLAADGPSGRWEARAHAGATATSKRALSVELKNLTFDEVALAAGLKEPQFFFDTPLSMKIDAGLDDAGAIQSLQGQFDVGAGIFYTREEDFEPLHVDRIDGALRWDPANQRVEIQPTEWRAGETRMAVSGWAAPPDSADGPWRIQLKSEPGSTLGREFPGDTPLDMDNTSLQASFNPATRHFTLDSLEAAGPDLHVRLSGSYDWSDDSKGLHAALIGDQTPIRAALRIWPSFIAPPVHAYLLEHLTAGVLQQGAMTVDFDGPALENAFAKRPPADNDLKIDFTITGATLHFLPGVPPLTTADAVGHVTGHTVSVAVSHGVMDGASGHRLNLSEGSFTVPDTTLKPSPAEISTRLAGNLDSLGDILSRDAFRTVVGAGMDLSAGKGQVDGHLTVDIKIDKVTKPGDTQIRANASVTDLVIEKLLGKERFEQGQLALVVDKTGMRATGQGRLLGSPSQIEFKKGASAPMDATVTFQIDDAARARIAPAFATGVTGTILARVNSLVATKDVAPAQVELDFAKVAFDNPLPGLVKPAGRPAKASFRLTPTGDGAHIDQLVFDSSAGSSARGAIDLDSSGSMKSATFSQLRLSPGDDMTVHVEQAPDAMRIVARGQSIDARPFLRGVFGPGGPATPGARDTMARDMDIDLKTSLASGNNNQVLSGVDMKMSRHDGVIRAFTIRAMSGRAALTANTVRDAAGGSRIEMESTDGGGLLSFVDLYRHMEGGRLRLSLQPGPRGVTGSMFVRDFVLRDEPALRRLVTEGGPANAGPSGPGIDTAAAPFQRLSASFTRDNGALKITEGVLVGSQIGIKLEGLVDFPRDHVDMTGTFVPIYGLNNLFTQIPLVGPLMGGNHEGLFAVNFRVAGRATAPNLIINPLSAIAPGFLRNIFGPGGIDPTALRPPYSTEAPATIPAGQ